jgi:hypothetical protein
MEESVFKNQFLIFYMQDLTEIFFWEDKKSNPPGSSMIRRSITQIESTVLNNLKYKEFDKRISEQLQQDFLKVKEQLEFYSEVQEIYDFTYDWNQKRKQSATGNGSASLEMGFYKETWAKMDKFYSMIENLPASQTRLGSILLETATLKKQLAEMPRSITESIRHNVAETMETETKLLKDELNNASEVLDAVPTKLEQYVE